MEGGTKEKVLIIKIGYSEVLEGHNNSRRVSFGDVLRTTPLLHLYKDSEVTWVTDMSAFPLLEGNPFIHRLLPYDLTTVLQLESEEFDTVINLEKVPGICAFSDKIRARKRKYGFTFNTQTGMAEALDKASEILSVGFDLRRKKENKKLLQSLLFEMVGEVWNGEEYILGYKPKSQEIYDVGLNTLVGQKWPTKSWMNEKWDELEAKLIAEGFKVSRQDKQDARILTNLENYMDWINSCKIIVSNDSLGMHLGIALKKKVLGLFGPTPYTEVCFYQKGEAILLEPLPDCMPCFKAVCEMEQNCMNDISVEKVYEIFKKYNENNSASLD